MFPPAATRRRRQDLLTGNDEIAPTHHPTISMSIRIRCAVFCLIPVMASAGPRIYTSPVYAKDLRCQAMYAMEDGASTSEAISLLRRNAGDLLSMSARDQGTVIEHFSRYSDLLIECERAADQFAGRTPEKMSASSIRSQYRHAFLKDLPSSETLAESVASLKMSFQSTYNRRAAALGITSSRYLQAVLKPIPSQPVLLPPAGEDPALDERINALELKINHELRVRAKRAGASLEDYAFLVSEYSQTYLTKAGLHNFPDHWARLVPAIKKIEAGEKFKLQPYFGPR